MKKSVYAVCGSLMILAAALTRTVSDGGPELIALMVLGVMTLIASADLPQQSTKGRT